MKTKIQILLIIVLIGHLANSQQLPNLSKSKVLLDSKNKKSLEVPLFKSVKPQSFKPDEIGKMLKRNYPKTTSTIVPKAVSSSSSALNVELTPNRLRTDKAGLVIQKANYSDGYDYVNNPNLSILFPHANFSTIGIWFKTTPGKYYFIQLEYKEYIRDCSGNLKFKIRLGGNTHLFNVKRGSINKHTFVAEATGSRLAFNLFGNYNFSCNGNYISANLLSSADLNKVTIQELTN